MPAKVIYSPKTVAFAEKSVKDPQGVFQELFTSPEFMEIAAKMEAFEKKAEDSFPKPILISKILQRLGVVSSAGEAMTLVYEGNVFVDGEKATMRTALYTGRKYVVKVGGTEYSCDTIPPEE